MLVKNAIKFVLLLFILFVPSALFAQQSNPFKVVLDAGHGGKDPGTMRGSIREKDIVLDVVLRLGKLLEQHNSVKVFYTRKTDVFIDFFSGNDQTEIKIPNFFLCIYFERSMPSSHIQLT